MPPLRRCRIFAGAGVCALALCATPAPASADVLELAADGTVYVRASDVPLAVSSTASVDAPEKLDELGLPAEAVTLVATSAAPAAYAAAVEYLSELNHLSPALLEALVWQESRWRASARSPAGAIGLAQLMPGTARELGVDPRDATANLAGGARYLRQQLDRFDGDIELALAAYNAGPGRVMRDRAIPRIRETEQYVRSVIDRLSSRSVSTGAKP